MKEGFWEEDSGEKGMGFNESRQVQANDGRE